MVAARPLRPPTDVLVLGAGPAGLAAAITAARAGATVRLVEATGQLGGNAPFATGNLALAATALQAAHGVDDSAEIFLTDIDDELRHQDAAYRPEVDRAVLERVVAEGPATYAFLTGLGLTFRGLVDRPKQHSRPRLSALTDPDQFRALLPEVLRGLGGEIVLRARARALTVDKGQIGGVDVDTPAGPAHCPATAVVIATGGFAASPELRQRFRPDQDPHTTYPGIPSATGDGHQLAEQAGAELVNMHMVVPIIRASARILADSIAINAEGRRFHDETAHHDQRLSHVDAQPGGLAYYLFDARHADRDARFIADVPARARRLDRLADVAAVIGCDPEVLGRTVEQWNAVVAGRTPDPYGRMVFPEPRVGLAQGPFLVLPVVRGIASTVGGARVDPDMRVLDPGRRPLPGLFAAGDAVGLLNLATGLGGIHLASAVTSGRLAGASAAREALARQ